MMMGKSLAQAGRKVLLIDTDIHGKTLTQRFKLADQAGFVDFVRDKEIDRDLIVETETNGLSILPAGKVEEGKVALEQIANGAPQKQRRGFKWPCPSFQRQFIQPSFLS